MIGDALGAALFAVDGDGLLFPGIRFETAAQRRTTAKYWHLACDNAGVPRTNLYQLRKLRITLWIASGIEDDVITKMAGHTDIKITHEAYNDVTRERIRKSLTGEG